MLAIDVNLIVSAFRADAPDHSAGSDWLERAVDDPEPLGISDTVLAGVVRIVTNRRVFTTITPLHRALEQVAGLRTHPGVVTLAPGARHWEIFDRLCRSADARGYLVAAAAHAAVAVEHGATWVSKDRDYARFRDLRWRHPYDVG